MASTQSVTTIELERGGTGTGSWLKRESQRHRPSPMVIQRAQPASGNAGQYLVWRPFVPGSEVAIVRVGAVSGGRSSLTSDAKTG